METIDRLPPNALHPLPEDKRDLSHSAVFGAPNAPSDLPDEYLVSQILGIKDQGGKDFCAGYAAAEVSEDQEDIELDPNYPFMVAKRILGGDAWKTYGLNLRDVCNAALVGFIQADQFPFKDDDRKDDRDFLANPANWPADLDLVAADHKKGSYFAVDGPYDAFDNIRGTIWKNRLERRSVLTGALWRRSWTVPGGIVLTEYTDAGSGHAFKVLGWTTHANVPYLVVVNSWGDQVGDHGLFYFPREVVNKEYVFGMFTFRDMPKEEARYYQDNGITKEDSPWKKLWLVLVTFISRFIPH